MLLPPQSRLFPGALPDALCKEDKRDKRWRALPRRDAEASGICILSLLRSYTRACLEVGRREAAGRNPGSLTSRFGAKIATSLGTG